MSYDPNKLRALRDNIDVYLETAQEEDRRIYDALENSIAGAVTKSLEPLVKQLSEKIDQLAPTKQD